MYFSLILRYLRAGKLEYHSSFTFDKHVILIKPPVIVDIAKIITFKREVTIRFFRLRKHHLHISAAAHFPVAAAVSWRAAE